jgi:O-antigen/teichoic acid export membrane protein
MSLPDAGYDSTGSPSAEAVERGVYHRSLQGGKWYLANVIGQKTISLVTFFVLARLLLPEDYGVITVVLLVVGLFGQLTNPSFGAALIQKKDTVEPYLDTYWTAEILRALALAALLYLAAPWIALFFNIPSGLLPILQLSGLLLVIPSFSNVRNLYLFKELNFRNVFFRDIVTQFGFSFASIGSALAWGGSPWSLFFGYAFQYTIGVGASYYFFRSKPAFDFHVGRLRDLVGYSKWVYGQDVLEVFLAQLDKIFVGRWLDPAQLGIYSRSKDLASTATNTVASMLAKVGLPAFAKIQNQMEKVRLGFLKSVDVILMVSVPVTLLLLLEGGILVEVLLGQAWLVIVVPLKIFAFGNLFLAFLSMVNPILAALGRPDINFKTNLIKTFLSVPLMYAGLMLYGVHGLAWAVVATWMLMLGYVVLRARRILQIPKRDFFSAFWSGGWACTAVFLCDVAFRLLRTEPAYWLFSLAQVAFLGVLYYITLFAVGRRRSSGPYATARSILLELSLIKKRP